MAIFVDLLKSSALIQGALALVLVGSLVYQIVSGVEPSNTLLIMANVVLGYYFGTKSQQGLQQAAKDAVKEAKVKNG